MARGPPLGWRSSDSSGGTPADDAGDKRLDGDLAREGEIKTLGTRWAWILIANALLGISQGLTWSTTVIMKIDLAGAARRGLAMGLNEFAAYLAVTASVLTTRWIAACWGLRPEPFYVGVVFAAAGLGLSALVVRETRHHVSTEARLHGAPASGVPSPREVFWRTTLLDRNLREVRAWAFLLARVVPRSSAVRLETRARRAVRSPNSGFE